MKGLRVGINQTQLLLSFFSFFFSFPFFLSFFSTLAGSIAYSIKSIDR